MAVLPKSRTKLLTFFETRLSQWSDNAAALQLSQADLDALEQHIVTARLSHDMHEEAEQTALARTAAYHTDTDKLRRLGSMLVQQMRNTATYEQNPEILQIALLPEPAQPSPRPAPPTPLNVHAAQRKDGSVQVRWKGRFGEAAFFTVRRKLRFADGSFVPAQVIGTTARRSFVDETVPLHTLEANYEVQAQRGEKKSFFSNPAVIRTAGEKATTNAEFSRRAA